jgi:tetratricopeptide (TPR) repeat protein
LVDRDETLKKAEKLLRAGKLDGAIAAYVRLVESQPTDWSVINALGDLYLRAGDRDRAVAQFTRVADHLYAEGFYPKAAALYKKALKVKPDHDHTLLRLSEIAARQGLLADAKLYLRQLAKVRRDRGDDRGAQECLVRLGLLEEADAESKLEAATAARALGDTGQAASLYVVAAAAFEKQRRAAEALDALLEAAALSPDDVSLRGRAVQACVAAGRLDRAQPFLTLETAGDNPDLLLWVGRSELSAGRDAAARRAFTRLVTVAPERAPAILDVVEEFAAAGDRDRAWGCAEVVADAALLLGDFDQAIATLQRFLRHGPYIPALVKLVEVSGDAGRNDVLRAVQADLVNAYLHAGRGAEARAVAEDLVASEATNEMHVERLRRVLELLGEPEPERVLTLCSGSGEAPLDEQQAIEIADLSTAPAPPAAAPGAAVPAPAAVRAALAATDEAVDPFEPSGGSVRADVGPQGGLEIAPLPRDDEAIIVDAVEIDLTEALGSLGSAPSAPTQEALRAPQDLEAVFEEMRARVARDRQVVEAERQLGRAVEALGRGRVAEAIADFQQAARVPQVRFRAAAELGRLYLSRGELLKSVEWLERAAEAPAPTPEDGLAVLYDLADALERAGETARALAVLMEIDADAHAYRDVAARIEHLTRGARR